jgi:thiamine-phosphate pyrophosphorylase
VIDREIPILCYVTDRRSLLATAVATHSALVQKIAVVSGAGVDWVQIREKDLSGRQLAILTREAVARRSGARIIVNDRLDVAVAENAGGVHLGEASLPVADVAKWVNRTESGVVLSGHGAASKFHATASGEFLIGASCHSLESARTAASDGATYIFFGPVFATPSKAKFGEPQGVKKLAEVCSAVPVPVMAIGGITLENAGQCISAGVAGIAAIRLFQDAAEPAQVISTLKQMRR